MLKRASAILHMGFGCVSVLWSGEWQSTPPGTLGEAYPMTGQLREHIWGHPWARSPPLETIRETCCDGNIFF